MSGFLKSDYNYNWQTPYVMILKPQCERGPPPLSCLNTPVGGRCWKHYIKKGGCSLAQSHHRHHHDHQPCELYYKYFIKYFSILIFPPLRSCSSLSSAPPPADTSSWMTEVILGSGILWLGYSYISGKFRIFVREGGWWDKYSGMNIIIMITILCSRS